MEPCCFTDIDFSDRVGDHKQVFSVSLLCFPFFSLEKHVNSRLRAGSASHPARPLLQAHTRTVNDKRELSQVTAKRSSTPKGHCLHVSTLWTLIVNRDTMITCSSLSLEELQSDFVSTVQPPPTTPSETVRVRAGSSRSWQIPVQDVRFLPSLLALFSERFGVLIGPDRWAEFRHEGSIVNGKKWPAILAKGKKTQVELTLQEAHGVSRHNRSNRQAILQSVLHASALERLVLHCIHKSLTHRKMSPNSRTAILKRWSRPTQRLSRELLQQCVEWPMIKL
jgi:hypothetical protein